MHVSFLSGGSYFAGTTPHAVQRFPTTNGSLPSESPDRSLIAMLSDAALAVVTLNQGALSEPPALLPLSHDDSLSAWPLRWSNDSKHVVTVSNGSNGIARFQPAVARTGPCGYLWTMQVTRPGRAILRGVWAGVLFASGACGGRSLQPSGGEPPPAASGANAPGPASGGSSPEVALGGVASTDPTTSTPGAGSSSTPGAGSSSTPTPTPTAAGGSGATGSSPHSPGEPPPEMTACSAQAGALQAQLRWQDTFSLYGSVDYPFMGFSPDGAELLVPVEELSRTGNRSYTVADGQLLIQPLPVILGRDAPWSRQLLAEPYTPISLNSVADVANGTVLASVAPESSWPLQARLSADGQYLFQVNCADGLQVERLRLEDGDISRVPLGPGSSLCVGYGHPGFILPLAVSRSNDTVVVGAERRGFALADFKSGSATFSLASDAAATTAERKANQPVPSDALTLELAPSEHRLATIDASGILRVLEYPELVQALPELMTAVTSAFAQSYVTSRVLAPIAWSPDERYLATADETHATVVRRACDGSVAVALPAPTIAVPQINDDPNWVPAFLAFNRQGLGLAVVRVNKRFRATVSYYDLSPAVSN